MILNSVEERRKYKKDFTAWKKIRVAEIKAENLTPYNQAKKISMLAQEYVGKSLDEALPQDLRYWAHCWLINQLPVTISG